jgi:hypothetical protein
MNTIYNKLKPKRKYKRKPLCADINGICSIDKCRCDMGIKILKTKGQAKLDEHLLHREKVIQKIRQKQLQELDNDYLNLKDPVQATNLGHFEIQGEYGKRKEQVKKYKRMMYWAMIIMLAIPFLYIAVIEVIDLISN